MHDVFFLLISISEFLPIFAPDETGFWHVWTFYSHLNCNRKSVFTIQIWFRLWRFRKNFSSWYLRNISIAIKHKTKIPWEKNSEIRNWKIYGKYYQCFSIFPSKKNRVDFNSCNIYYIRVNFYSCSFLL